MKILFELWFLIKPTQSGRWRCEERKPSLWSSPAHCSSWRGRCQPVTCGYSIESTFSALSWENVKKSDDMMRDLSSLAPLWAPMVAWVPSDLTRAKNEKCSLWQTDQIHSNLSKERILHKDVKERLTQAKPGATGQSWQAGHWPPPGAEGEVFVPEYYHLIQFKMHLNILIQPKFHILPSNI